MTNDTVTNKELYTAIMDVHKKMDEIVQGRITPLEIWRANLTGQIAVLSIALGLAVNFVFDWIKEKLKG